MNVFKLHDIKKVPNKLKLFELNPLVVTCFKNFFPTIAERVGFNVTVLSYKIVQARTAY